MPERQGTQRHTVITRGQIQARIARDEPGRPSATLRAQLGGRAPASGPVRAVAARGRAVRRESSTAPTERACRGSSSVRRRSHQVSRSHRVRRAHNSRAYAADGSAPVRCRWGQRSQRRQPRTARNHHYWMTNVADAACRPSCPRTATAAAAAAAAAAAGAAAATALPRPG